MIVLHSEHDVKIEDESQEMTNLKSPQTWLNKTKQKRTRANEVSD